MEMATASQILSKFHVDPKVCNTKSFSGMEINVSYTISSLTLSRSFRFHFGNQKVYFFSMRIRDWKMTWTKMQHFIFWLKFHFELYFFFSFLRSIELLYIIKVGTEVDCNRYILPFFVRIPKKYTEHIMYVTEKLNNEIQIKWQFSFNFTFIALSLFLYLSLARSLRQTIYGRNSDYSAVDTFLFLCFIFISCLCFISTIALAMKPWPGFQSLPCVCMLLIGCLLILHNAFNSITYPELNNAQKLTDESNPFPTNNFICVISISHFNDTKKKIWLVNGCNTRQQPLFNNDWTKTLRLYNWFFFFWNWYQIIFECFEWFLMIFD